MIHVDLSGHVAIVTGGARGIGYAAAERLLRAGAAVSLWDLDGARLAQAQAALGPLGSVSTETVELTSEEAVAAATASAVAKHGKIDVLINNAGITGGNGKTWELPPEVWRRVIEVNFVAPFLVCRAVVPEMLKAAGAASSPSRRSPARRVIRTRPTTRPRRRG